MLEHDRRHILSGHEDTVWYVLWSPEGKTLASVSNDLTIRLWSPDTGQCLIDFFYGISVLNDNFIA